MPTEQKTPLSREMHEHMARVEREMAHNEPDPVKRELLLAASLDNRAKARRVEA